MNPLKTFIAIALGLALVACGSTADLPSIEERLAERGYLMGPNGQQIPQYRISGWSAVDDRYLIVSSGVRDEYLVELQGPCFQLDGALFVGFATPTSRLDRFGDVVVGSGPLRQRCSIRDIYLLSDIDG